MKGLGLVGKLVQKPTNRLTYVEDELQGSLRHGHPLCLVHGAGDHDPHVAGGVVGAVLAGGEDHDAVGQLCGRGRESKPKGQ